MNSVQKPFQLGDRVIHAAKPDWGTGHVLSAKPDPENGPHSQKLQVRFQHSGMKTLSTTYATLRPVSENGDLDQANTPTPNSSSPHDSQRPDIDADPALAMSTLPSGATDPFATPAKRLQATLAMYRFTGEGGSLIEWATLQSGMADPLTRFSRHDLEEFFSRYAVLRDRHLVKVKRENMKTDSKALSQIVKEAPPGATEALRRINRRS